MSNCIEIVHPRIVRLRNEYVDVQRLRGLVERVKNLDDAPDWQADPDGNIAWWFLSTNVEFHDDCVEISLGYGRSSHTNRDFGATLLLLAKFMLKPTRIFVTFRDEYDGFETMQRAAVELTKPEWYGFMI